MKGQKTGGRRQGSTNRVTASVKAALTEAFDNHGGVKSLNRWAKDNETEFFRLWGRLVPSEVSAEVKVKGKLEVTVKIAREGRRLTAG